LIGREFRGDAVVLLDDRLDLIVQIVDLRRRARRRLRRRGRHQHRETGGDDGECRRHGGGATTYASQRKRA